MGKQLPTNIYELINYIEANAIDEEAQQHLKKRKVQAERAKVLRETRMIPKVIMVIEDFNKHIILLSKKTKAQNRLTDYLHFGTMRDFDIKSTDLKAAIERSISDGRNIAVDESHAEEDEEDDAQSCGYPEEVEDVPDQDEPVQVEKKSQRRRRVLSSDSEDSHPKRKRGRKPAEKQKSPLKATNVEEQARTSKPVRSKKDTKKPARASQEKANSDAEEPPSIPKTVRSKKDKKKPAQVPQEESDGEDQPAKKTRASRARPSIEVLESDGEEQLSKITRASRTRSSIDVLESDDDEQPAKKPGASSTRLSMEEMDIDDEEQSSTKSGTSRTLASPGVIEIDDEEQPAKKTRASRTRTSLEESNGDGEEQSSKKAKETRKPKEPVAKDKPLIRVRLGLLRSGRSGKLDWCEF